MNRHQTLKAVLATMLAVIPRTAWAYAGYCIAPLVLVDYRRLSRSSLLGGAALLAFTLASMLVNSQVATVSITAFALELVLITPFALFALGARLSIQPLTALQVIRALNILLLVGSLVNLFTKGFPFRLPYLDYLPDEFWGTYGRGGAQIVTLVGFFGLMAEIEARQLRNRVLIVVAAVNFLAPSYLLGVVAGACAFLLVFRKRPWASLAAIVVMLPSLLYVYARSTRLNSTLYNVFGHDPKVLAFTTVKNLAADSLQVPFLGTGLGQFSSTPAQWASTTLQASASSHQVPNLPGLHSSSFYADFLDPLLRVGLQNKYSISSVMNKPFSSMSSLLAEWGFIVTLVVLVLLVRRFWSIRRAAVTSLSVGLFAFILLVLDVWHDVPWFGLMLLLYWQVAHEGVTESVRASRLEPAPGIALPGHSIDADASDREALDVGFTLFWEGDEQGDSYESPVMWQPAEEQDIGHATLDWGDEEPFEIT